MFLFPFLWLYSSLFFSIFSFITLQSFSLLFRNFTWRRLKDVNIFKRNEKSDKNESAKLKGHCWRRLSENYPASSLVSFGLDMEELHFGDSKKLSCTLIFHTIITKCSPICWHFNHRILHPDKTFNWSKSAHIRHHSSSSLQIWHKVFQNKLFQFTVLISEGDRLNFYSEWMKAKPLTARWFSPRFSDRELFQNLSFPNEHILPKRILPILNQ
jgi:hypothetical protein